MADFDSPTVIRQAEQHHDRWTAYDDEAGILAISERLTSDQLKKYDIFKNYDNKFLKEISPDVTIARWRRGSVLFEEGSYIDIAFHILQGEVEVSLETAKEDSVLNRPIFDPNRTMMFENTEQIQAAKSKQKNGKDGKKGKTDIVFLSVMDFNIPLTGGHILKQGEFFGEIGALSGWPQSVTARAATDCELIQIRVSALRSMKRKSKDLKNRLDKIYKEKYVDAQLKQTPLLQYCGDDFIKSLTPRIELVSCGPGDTVTEEGKPADAIYLMRSGFLKLTQNVGEGQLAVSYLSKGMTIGEVELLLDGIDNWIYTASSVAHAELIKISKEDFLNLIREYPKVEKLLWDSAIKRVKESGYSRRDFSQSQFIETALEKGLVQGNSILVIDLETCTRCDDCVRGCSETHGGLPRFVREGDKYQNLLIPKACYHCRDPLCLVGCPTGAIHRTNVGDVVAIDDRLCIGCQTCAISCPYDAIIMHDMEQVWPDDMMPARLRGKKRLLASKCDLCYTSDTGPACERSCPNGCAVRVGSIDEFRTLLSKD